MDSARVEIEFPRQDAVSVFLETTASGRRESELETLLFCLYATRQLANLRGDSTLTTALQTIDDDEPLSSVAAAMGEVTEVSPTRSGGRKAFHAAVDVRSFDSERDIRLRLKPRGFGLLARGVGYYAPVSVLALLKHLLEKHRQDGLYQRRMALAARDVGLAAEAGIINVRSQVFVALEAAHDAWHRIGDIDGA